jgi:hypothetical protein
MENHLKRLTKAMLYTSLLFCLCSTQATAEKLESASHKIEYKSPMEALTELKKRKDVAIREENDWIIVNDKTNNTIWSIASKKHSAYPTAVKRVIYEKDGTINLSFDMQCGAEKWICDKVFLQFQEMTETIQQDHAKQHEH